MQRAVVLVNVGILLCLSTIVRGQQASPVPVQVAGRATARDCSNYFNARLEARQILERDRRALAVAADSSSDPRINSAGTQPIDLQQDLKIFDQTEMELNLCTLGNNGLYATQDSLPSCSREQALNFEMNHDGEQEREVPIWRRPGDTAFFYESGMTIDADGAPNAYHPDNTGLDDLANAGAPGHWQGLAKNTDGEPFVQGPDDPFPGYYVSTTALSDRTKPVNDPSRYLDATKIPYIVLPGFLSREIGVHPGDFAVVVNLRNGLSSYAIFGDIGPFDRIGEGSMALAENLGIQSDARNGGARRGIAYLVFSGSGESRPRTKEEIDAEAGRLLQAWGGVSQLISCMVPEPGRQGTGVQSTN